MRLIKLLAIAANDHFTGKAGDVRRCPEQLAGVLVGIGQAEYLDEQPDYQYTSPKFQSFIDEVDSFSRDYQRQFNNCRSYKWGDND